MLISVLRKLMLMIGISFTTRGLLLFLIHYVRRLNINCDEIGVCLFCRRRLRTVVMTMKSSCRGLTRLTVNWRNPLPYAAKHQWRTAKDWWRNIHPTHLTVLLTTFLSRMMNGRLRGWRAREAGSLKAALATLVRNLAWTGVVLNVSCD